MTTYLLSTTYLDGTDKIGNDRLERTERWLEHVSNIAGDLGVNHVVLLDNCSDIKNIRAVERITRKQLATTYGLVSIEIDRQGSLPRGPGKHDYPYCWRGMWYCRNLIDRGAKKIIFLDNDAFLISRRLRNYIRDINSGWTAFWSPAHSFPTTELNVLCEDYFPEFIEYTKDHWAPKVGLTMENDPPFTLVNKEFVMDRYGEWRARQTPDMDAYLQAPTDIRIQVE